MKTQSQFSRRDDAFARLRGPQHEQARSGAKLGAAAGAVAGGAIGGAVLKPGLAAVHPGGLRKMRGANILAGAAAAGLAGAVGGALVGHAADKRQRASDFRTVQKPLPAPRHHREKPPGFERRNAIVAGIRPSPPAGVAAEEKTENHATRNAAMTAGVSAPFAYFYLRSKRRALDALTPGMIAFARTPAELLKTRRVPWVMRKTGHGPEIRYSPRAAAVKDPARREALAGYADDVHDARASIAASVKRDRKYRLTLHCAPRHPRAGVNAPAPSGEGFATLTPGMISFDSRPRTAEGTFAGGDTAGSPADMTAAYGHPASRPSALLPALVGGGAAGATGALTAAALAALKRRKK